MAINAQDHPVAENPRMDPPRLSASYKLTWGVAALGFCFHVLDCVDGNMARTAGTASKLGGLVDGFVDLSFWCLLFLSLGLLVERAGGGIFGDRACSLPRRVRVAPVARSGRSRSPR